MECGSEQISVIIPVYNAEHSLEECVDSVLRQTYVNFEIILVNDGSSDNSLAIIHELQKKDSRIKCVNTENMGVSHARNAGIAESVGEYIAFLDADDYLATTMLEKMYRAISIYNADIAVCQYATCEMTEKDELYDVSTIGKTELLGEMMLPQRNIAAFVWNRLYRASVIKSNNIKFDESVKVCEDTLFNFMTLESCGKIVVVDEPLYYYRINSDSAMFKPQFNKNKLTANIAYETMLQKVTKGLERNQIEIACMLYNEILLTQVYKYRYKLSVEEKYIVKKMLRLNPMYFLRSEVSWKYKLAYLFLAV